MNTNIFKIIFLLVAFLVLPDFAKAANTFYVDGGAVDDTGSGAQNSPKKYITSGLQLMLGGDTLIIEDGIYAGENNMIGDYSNPRYYPPSGTVGTYTMIQARNVEQVIIDGEYLRAPFSMIGVVGRDYLHIDGIHFRRGVAGVFNIRGSYNKVTNCGMEDGLASNTDTETEIASVIGGSSYTLIEDCWVWGKGRYGFYTSSSNGGANHVIFRRIVVRFDSSPSGEKPTSGIRFYNGDTNSAQNVVVLDSNIASDAYYPEAVGTGGGSSTTGEPNHTFYGIISLNNLGMSGYHFEMTRNPVLISNSVVWGGDMGIESSGNNTAGLVINAQNVTAGQNTRYEFYRNINYTGMLMNVADSIAVTESGGQAYLNPNSLSNSEHYIAPGGSAGQSTGSTLITEVALNEKLKYLPRPESGTAGATILYQIGVSGTLHGEAGWNTTTTQPLWPFANEAMWAAKMKTYNASGPGGNRGFAALAGSTQTPLTDYIWGYLGNPKPDIYGENDIVAPSAPTGLGAL
ncbi:MAG: hypothetical protein HGA36_02930 [Candidatus Moranbacteria bacterium]|nr:hypothetical protein [Candidatus Moranbacteria bacterium]